ncbi:MAG: thiamine diphosphokinase [Christensenella sp.]|nr:thiamine diphosphokinase [Christensenella sp.]
MKAAIILNSPNLNRHIDEEVVIAADKGYEFALKQGIIPDIVIGDFDSSAIPTNLNVLKLNVEKNETDGQEALAYAIKKGYDEIAIYGISGGRLDHEMGNLSLLKSGEEQGVSMVGKEYDVDIYFKSKGKYAFKTQKGKEFSIITFMEDSIISNGIGVKYPIDDLRLSSNSLGRAISNVAIKDEISFEVLEGGVLIFLYR